MYQQRIETDSASIEGMEGVFEEKAPELPDQINMESFETPAVSLPQAGGKVLRGTYNQGLLFLREETLKPLAVAQHASYHQNRQPARILYSNNTPGEALRSFETKSSNNGEIAYSGGLVETNSEILELIRQHAEQAKVANALIKRLTQQLQDQSEYIERLRSGLGTPNIWERFWRWISRR